MDFYSTDGFPETAIRLASGEVFDYENPEDAVITYHDVAHALARETRFAGHAGAPGVNYTVGQHAIFVTLLVTFVYDQPELAFAALHHDDAEFVTKDWPSPLKRFAKLHGFDYKRVLERPIETVLVKQLGLVLDDLHAGVVKEADRLAFVTEGTFMKHGFNRHDQGFDDIEPDMIRKAAMFLPAMSVAGTEAMMLSVDQQLRNGADPVLVLKSLGATSLRDQIEAQENGEDDEASA